MIRTILVALVLGLLVMPSPGSAACTKCTGGECDTTAGDGGCECNERIRIIFGVAFKFCRATGSCSDQNNSCDNNNPPAAVIDVDGRAVRISVADWMIDDHLAEDPLLGGVLLALVEGDHNELRPGRSWGNVARVGSPTERTDAPAVPNFDYEATAADRGDGTLGLDIAIMVEGADEAIPVSGWVGIDSGHLTTGEGADSRTVSWVKEQ